MSGALEGVAQNWLTDQPWQKVDLIYYKIYQLCFISNNKNHNYLNLIPF